MLILRVGHAACANAEFDSAACDNGSAAAALGSSRRFIGWFLPGDFWFLVVGNSLAETAHVAIVAQVRNNYFRFPFAKCLVRKSASTSTRAGRGPPGGVTRCTAPSACFQPFRITSTSPDATASPTIKSGRSAMPSPASNAGISASPLLTRSGPAGRTLTSSPAALV